MVLQQPDELTVANWNASVWKLPTLTISPLGCALTCGSSRAPSTAAGAVSITITGKPDCAEPASPTARRRVIIGGHVPGSSREGAEAPVRAQTVRQVVHTKLAVAHSWRRGAVIEYCQRQGVGRQRSAERGKRSLNGRVIEITRPDVDDTIAFSPGCGLRHRQLS